MTSNSPFFSIVIPSYNRADFLPLTLNSVLEQVFFDFEVIVIDDGSTDHTSQIIKPYLADRRVYYYQIKNSERGAARNIGVLKSFGRYVTFLDSDDLLLPWHLKTAYDKIQIANAPPAFHLAYEIMTASGKRESLSVLPSPVNEKLLEGNFLSCIGIFLERSIAIENPFDEDRCLAGSEDYELWLRIASKLPILAFGEVTSRLVNHTARSVVNTDSQRLIFRIELLKKRLFSNPNFGNHFGKGVQKFDAYITLYCALHLAMIGSRWKALINLLNALRLYPPMAWTYRFMVAGKKILLW